MLTQMKDNYEQSGKNKIIRLIETRRRRRNRRTTKVSKQLLNTENNTSVLLFTIFSFPPPFFLMFYNNQYKNIIKLFDDETGDNKKTRNRHSFQLMTYVRSLSSVILLCLYLFYHRDRHRYI